MKLGPSEKPLASMSGGPLGARNLRDNPLLREPLTLDHIKPRLLGHWGTTPGLNFVYVHLNRLIRKLDLNVLYIAGPGHGGPGLVAWPLSIFCASISPTSKFASSTSSI